MSWVFACWRIKIQMQISWVGRSTRDQCGITEIEPFAPLCSMSCFRWAIPLRGLACHCLVGPKQYPTKEDSTTQYKIVPHSTKYYDAMLHNVFYKLAQSCRKQKRISDYSVCYWGTLNYYCAIEVHCAIGVNCAIGPHCAIGVHCAIGPHAKWLMVCPPSLLHIHSMIPYFTSPPFLLHRTKPS